MSPCVSPVLCHLLSHLPPTKGDQTGKWGGLGGSEGWGESGGHSGRSGGSGSDLGLVPTLAPPPPMFPTVSCGPHFCSINSCCLVHHKVGDQKESWVCGCPPGMAPTPQNSSTISCQGKGANTPFLPLPHFISPF